MFSEALKMMDDNMYQYMADQHTALVKEQQGKIDNLCILLIEQMKENNKSKEDAVKNLVAACDLSYDKAKELVDKNW